MIVKNLFFGLIILAVVLEVIGDILFKKYAINNKYLFLILGLIVYFVGTIFWAISLRYAFLSKAILVFTVLNLIAVVLVGIVMFKESLSLTNKIGLMLGVISIILIEL